MKIRKLIALMLTVFLALALVPSALAEEAAYEIRERKAMKRWDDVWTVLDAVEAEMMELGASRSEVTFAVYKAALNLDLIDEGSISDVTGNEFTFTTDGMLGGYNYRIRNFERVKGEGYENYAVPVSLDETERTNASTEKDVLLVGPYYGFDGSFTDQYKDEAKSIANVLGGNLTTLSGSAATGPAIAANYTNKAVVIYDSHGNCIASKNTSYLDLKTNTGLTSEDYSKGWAYNGGNFFGIDGRYILNHAAGPLSNCMVWMAICEGMKIEGQGTTGTALLQAGAACVYGYSQSVTFAGDYMYEEAFWTEMKNGATVCEAIEVMKATYGEPDPRGDAWPIVMSPVDAFPADPDGHQDVLCEWTLIDPGEHQLESFSVTDEVVDVYVGYNSTITFERVPDDANNYELEWLSEDPLVATVLGNSKKAIITGEAEGTTNIVCIVKVDGTEIGRASCPVQVKPMPGIDEVLNAAGGLLEFTNPAENYPWTVSFVDGEFVAMSSNAHIDSSSSSVVTTINMKANETLTFLWRVSSETNYDWLRFYVDDTLIDSISGNIEDWIFMSYTVDTDGEHTFRWTFEKDYSYSNGSDCGFLKEVAYSGQIEILSGDADGDGELSAADALLALRFSMGIIDFTPVQIVRCDMDGDGEVTAADALVILRKAMGILV
ncbi:MAG: Ig-like domain-containing protein [Clostridia bacterium]|nr:Ig-like domain-containing protein [Clostridia bacterium]